MFNGQLLLIAISVLGQFMGRLQDNGAIIQAARNSHQYGDLEDLVISEIEKLKESIKNGIPEMGIPPLDPLIITSLPLNLNMEQILTADVNLNEGILSGLLNFNVTDLKLSLVDLRAEFQITFNDMDLSGNYALNGTLLQGLDVYGDGILFAAIHDLVLEGKIYLTKDCNMIILDQFDLALNLDTANFVLTGFMNDNHFSNLIADELSVSLPSMINSADLSGITMQLKGLLNKVLAFLQFESK